MDIFSQTFYELNIFDTNHKTINIKIFLKLHQSIDFMPFDVQHALKLLNPCSRLSKNFQRGTYSNFRRHLIVLICFCSLSTRWSENRENVKKKLSSNFCINAISNRNTLHIESGLLWKWCMRKIKWLKKLYKKNYIVYHENVRCFSTFNPLFYRIL